MGNKKADPLHSHSQVLDLKRSNPDSFNKKYSYSQIGSGMSHKQ